MFFVASWVAVQTSNVSPFLFCMVTRQLNCVIVNPHQVLASYGHVRDLPAKSGSVVPTEDFK